LLRGAVGSPANEQIRHATAVGKTADVGRLSMRMPSTYRLDVSPSCVPTI
jgi:hypothetical protein